MGAAAYAVVIGTRMEVAKRRATAALRVLTSPRTTFPFYVSVCRYRSRPIVSVCRYRSCPATGHQSVRPFRSERNHLVRHVSRERRIEVGEATDRGPFDHADGAAFSGLESALSRLRVAPTRLSVGEVAL